MSGGDTIEVGQGHALSPSWPLRYAEHGAAALPSILAEAQAAGDTETAFEAQCAIDGDPHGLEYLFAEAAREEAEADAAYRYECFNRREWGIDQSEAWRDAYALTPVKGCVA